eukprot:NODE_1357_length_1167_cov_269.511691.p3 GENE.NODE_1357_length_1167_cov_269.511691~~NODE_1357_length_1167_cov_269.511691.p3  ORF type:complete len:129 (+),score=30.96 NODE_1357_length_1167_cov_269.511691:3-389(+)
MGDGGWRWDWREFDNYVIRLLVPSAMSAPAGSVGSSHHDAARALLSNFTYVQRLEDLRVSGRSLFSYLGWPAPAIALAMRRTRWNNAAPKAAKPKHLLFRGEQREWMRALNEPELRLFKWAASRQLSS